MTPEEIAEARELCAKATPGPWNDRWVAQVSGGVCCFIDTAHSRKLSTEADDLAIELECATKADASFIAAARELLPKALDEIERLRSERDDADRRASHYAEDAAITVAERDAAREEGRRAGIEEAARLVDKAAIADLRTVAKAIRELLS